MFTCRLVSPYGETTIKIVAIALVLSVILVVITNSRVLSRSVDKECRVFNLAWLSLFIINTIPLGLLHALAGQELPLWAALASALISDLGDLILLRFFCKILQGMENDIRAFPRAQPWLSPAIYLVGGLLSLSSVVMLVTQALENKPWQYRASEVFAFVYFTAVCVVFIIAILLKQKFNPRNRQEYIIPFWTVIIVASILAQILFFLAIHYIYYYLRGHFDILRWIPMADWALSILVFIVICNGSVQIGITRHISSIVPSSLHELGRRGDLYLSQ